MSKERNISVVSMKLKSFKFKDSHYKKPQEKEHTNSGLDYTADLAMCSQSEVFILIILVWVHFTKLVYFHQDRCKSFILYAGKLCACGLCFWYWGAVECLCCCQLDTPLCLCAYSAPLCNTYPGTFDSYSVLLNLLSTMLG